jgi:hypothetical protein
MFWADLNQNSAGTEAQIYQNISETIQSSNDLNFLKIVIQDFNINCGFPHKFIKIPYKSKTQNLSANDKLPIYQRHTRRPIPRAAFRAQRLQITPGDPQNCFPTI